MYICLHQCISISPLDNSIDLTPAPEPVEVGGADVVREAGAPAALPRHVQQVGGGAGRAVSRPRPRPQVPRVRGAPAEGGGGRQRPGGGGGGGLRQGREAPAACTTRRVPSQLCSLVTCYSH